MHSYLLRIKIQSDAWIEIIRVGAAFNICYIIIFNRNSNTCFPTFPNRKCLNLY